MVPAFQIHHATMKALNWQSKVWQGEWYHHITCLRAASCSQVQHSVCRIQCIHLVCAASEADQSYRCHHVSCLCNVADVFAPTLLEHTFCQCSSGRHHVQEICNCCSMTVPLPSERQPPTSSTSLHTCGLRLDLLGSCPQQLPEVSLC